MNHKHIILLLALAPGLALAQTKAKFDSETRNVGTALWHVPVTAEFKLTNTGSRPLKIDTVETSCGCTAAEWSKAPIQGGKQAKISITYDAEMLGHFEKQALVYTSGSKTPALLTLRGTVVAEKAGYDGDYAYEIGEIKLNREDLEFDDVNSGDTPSEDIEIFNAGSETYKPELMHLPKYLTATYTPEQIRPQHGGRITVTLDSRKLATMGLTQTKVYLSRYPGDKVGQDNEIDVSAVMLPSFASAAGPAPVTALSSDTLDLGTFDGRDKLRGTLTLGNTGQAPLQIRSAQVFSNALNINIPRKVAPGGQAKLKITLIRKYLEQNPRAKLRVLIITNDPKRPKIVVKVKAALK